MYLVRIVKVGKGTQAVAKYGFDIWGRARVRPVRPTNRIQVGNKRRD